MVGRFPRRGLPLFRIASDNFDGDVVAADLDIGYLIDPGLSFCRQQLRSQRQCGFDGALCVVFHGEVFDAGLQNFEGHRLSARHRFPAQHRQFEWAGDQLHEPFLAFENGGGAGHAAPGEQGGEHAVACGVGECAGFPHRQVADPCLAQSDIGHAGQVDGLAGLRVRQLEDVGNAECGREGAISDMVPASWPQGRCVAEPTLDFIGQGERLNDELAGGMRCFPRS